MMLLEVLSIHVSTVFVLTKAITQCRVLNDDGING